MAGDILEEAPLGIDFPHDPGDVRPEVPGVVLALSVAAERERLAGIAGRDKMNAAAPRSAIEGSEIVPDRSRRQGRISHPGHEHRRGKSAPLDETHSSVSGFGEVKSEVESADASAKAEAAKLFISVGGTNSHTRLPFHRDHVAWGGGSEMASGY